MCFALLSLVLFAACASAATPSEVPTATLAPECAHCGVWQAGDLVIHVVEDPDDGTEGFLVHRADLEDLAPLCIANDPTLASGGQSCEVLFEDCWWRVTLGEISSDSMPVTLATGGGECSPPATSLRAERRDPLELAAELYLRARRPNEGSWRTDARSAPPLEWLGADPEAALRALVAANREHLNAADEMPLGALAGEIRRWLYEAVQRCGGFIEPGACTREELSTLAREHAQASEERMRNRDRIPGEPHGHDWPSVALDDSLEGTWAGAWAAHGASSGVLTVAVDPHTGEAFARLTDGAGDTEELCFVEGELTEGLVQCEVRRGSDCPARSVVVRRIGDVLHISPRGGREAWSCGTDPTTYELFMRPFHWELRREDPFRLAASRWLRESGRSDLGAGTGQAGAAAVSSLNVEDAIALARRVSAAHAALPEEHRRAGRSMSPLLLLSIAADGVRRECGALPREGDSGPCTDAAVDAIIRQTLRMQLTPAP